MILGIFEDRSDGVSCGASVPQCRPRVTPTATRRPADDLPADDLPTLGPSSARYGHPGGCGAAKLASPNPTTPTPP